MTFRTQAFYAFIVTTKNTPTDLQLAYAKLFTDRAVKARHDAKTLKESGLSHTPGNRQATVSWYEANAIRHDEIAFNLANGLDNPYYV